MNSETSIDRYSTHYHAPVLWREIIEFLTVSGNGIYVDCTLGGGGHSNAILDTISSSGKVIGIDKDDDAIEFASKRLSSFDNFTAIKGNFSEIASILKNMQIEKVDGFLLDLGVSSHQLNQSIRGFTFSSDAPLDMRMDGGSTVTAASVLNGHSEKDLADIFYKFGEERRSYQIAAKVIEFRMKKKLESTAELKSIVGGFYHGKQQVKALARVFQSIRIYVNKELEELDKVLQDCLPLLKENGRLAVIAYHSLEDRLVKNTYKYWASDCICPPEFPVCQCDKKSQVELIKPFPMIPQKDEVGYNSRSRSAKFRVCIKRLEE